MNKAKEIKKLQIGFRPPEPDDAAVCPPDTDLWHCNNLHLLLPQSQRIAAWFQIHRTADLYKEDRSHLRWLQIYHPFTIWMMEEHSMYPSAKRLPVERLKALWTYDFPVSFASSFSWMVALAMLEEYTEIHFEGVVLTSQREAYLEAPNLMAWIGLARGLGIKITGEGRLFEPYLYGMEERMPPAWVSPDVAKDLIVDSCLETRARFRQWSIDSSYLRGS